MTLFRCVWCPSPQGAIAEWGIRSPGITPGLKGPSQLETPSSPWRRGQRSLSSHTLLGDLRSYARPKDRTQPSRPPPWRSVRCVVDRWGWRRTRQSPVCAVPISAVGNKCQGDCTPGPALTDHLLSSCWYQWRAMATLQRACWSCPFCPLRTSLDTRASSPLISKK